MSSLEAGSITLELLPGAEIKGFCRVEARYQLDGSDLQRANARGQTGADGDPPLARFARVMPKLLVATIGVSPRPRAAG
jgi:hypothetical protein